MRRMLASFVVATITSLSAFGNPLLEPWPGPHGGIPPFDQVRVSHFRPAFEVGIAEKRQEIHQIADNAEPATFANTLVALERSGATLRRVGAVFGVYTNNIPNAEIEALELEMSPVFSALSDELWQNGKIFQRLQTIRTSGEFDRLSAQERRLFELYEKQFILSGARLDAAVKAKVSAINQRLAELQTRFQQNLVADEKNDFLLVEDPKDLAGLPESLVADAAEEATKRGLSGKWAFTNSRSFIEPFLTYATNRALREKAFRMWVARGDQGNANDNNGIAIEILSLRQERSRLLGYPTFAHWKLADTMAADPTAAMDLMKKVWEPAVARVHEEVADMQRIVDTEGGKFKIEPWDYRFYAEKVRKEKYDIDLAALAPYLTIENVRRAKFAVAERLYGVTLRLLETAPVFAQGVTAYEVLRDGKVIGLWYFDPFARSGKRSGAWSSSFRDQNRLDGTPVLPIAYDSENFSTSGALSWDDAVTLFHEFGHAQHTLYSNVIFPSLAGTSTVGDFVELPSHFNENYLLSDEALKYLVDKDGKPIPAELVAKLKRSKQFNEGFATVEFLASGILDMMLHLMPTPPADMRAFEAQALREIGMPSEIVMRHRIPQFAHLFTGEGYAAGYYSYLWAQVLVADAYEAFVETGDLFHRATAERFFGSILSVGGSIEAKEAYRTFRGRDATVAALLREKGFPCGEEIAAQAAQ